MARAVWFTAPHVAELRDEDERPPAAGEIQVRAICSLVSAGTEMNVFRGQVATAAELESPTTAGTFPFPIKFGYQTVGEVAQAGAESGFAPGERVFVRHPHQDVFTVPADGSLVFRLGDVEPDKAVFSGMLRVALNALHDAPVRIGDCVAVSGLGLVGSFCGQLARKTAGTLILIDPLPNRRRLAAWIGADAVVAPEEAAAAIAEATDGRGADVFIEASGHPASVQTALDCTGTEGTIAMAAYYGTRQVPLTLAPAFHFRRLRIVSSWVGMVGSGLQPRWNPLRQRAVALAEVARLDVASLITHSVPFADAPAAYEVVDRHPGESLGVLLRYDTDPRGGR